VTALLHVSLGAGEPERVAAFLARLLAGTALPFPPFADSWIVFDGADDGTAVEVYPATHVLTVGADQVACRVGEPDHSPSFAHLALASPHDAPQVEALATAEGWRARRCERGPFACVEVWLENRLLVEVLDPPMRARYRNGMTVANWRRMFALE
jgi:hypothetical protein